MEPTVHSGPARALRAFVLAKRLGAGLTQVELAERLGVRQSFVSDVERGERRLDVVEFARLCRALGEEPGRLYTEFIAQAEL